MEPSTPLWEMPCSLIDTILSGACDWQELSNLLRQSRRGTAPEADPECLQPCCVLRLAHDASHLDGPFSRALQRQLDFRFANARRTVAQASVPVLTSRLFARGLPATELVAALWALARDPRDEVHDLATRLLREVQHQALRTFLGGSVDLAASTLHSR